MILTLGTDLLDSERDEREKNDGVFKIFSGSQEERFLRFLWDQFTVWADKKVLEIWSRDSNTETRASDGKTLINEKTLLVIFEGLPQIKGEDSLYFDFTKTSIKLKHFLPPELFSDRVVAELKSLNLHFRRYVIKDALAPEDQWQIPIDQRERDLTQDNLLKAFQILKSEQENVSFLLELAEKQVNEANESEEMNDKKFWEKVDETNQKIMRNNEKIMKLNEYSNSLEERLKLFLERNSSFKNSLS